MLGVLRALGAPARLCMGWHPIPYTVNHYKKLKESQSTHNNAKAKSSDNGKGSNKYVEVVTYLGIRS